MYYHCVIGQTISLRAEIGEQETESNSRKYLYDDNIQVDLACIWKTHHKANESKDRWATLLLAWALRKRKAKYGQVHQGIDLCVYFIDDCSVAALLFENDLPITALR